MKYGASSIIDQYPALKKDVQLEYKTGFHQLNNSLQLFSNLDNFPFFKKFEFLLFFLLFHLLIFLQQAHRLSSNGWYIVPRFNREDDNASNSNETSSTQGLLRDSYCPSIIEFEWLIEDDATLVRKDVQLLVWVKSIYLSVINSQSFLTY